MYHRARDSASMARDLGAEVRAARNAREWSMRDLATRIGTSQPFVSNIENGRTLPSLRTLGLLAEALEVPVTRLLPTADRIEGASIPAPARPDGGEEFSLLVDGVGTAVRELRRRHLLSTRALARLAGVSQALLSSIENGHTRPSVPSLYAIAGALDVSPSAVLVARVADRDNCN